jgi:exonuclease VII small subunit
MEENKTFEQAMARLEEIVSLLEKMKNHLMKLLSYLKKD